MEQRIKRISKYENNNNKQKPKEGKRGRNKDNNNNKQKSKEIKITPIKITPIKNYVKKIILPNNKPNYGVKNGFSSIFNSEFNNVNNIKSNTLYQKLLTTTNYPNEKNVYNKMVQNTINAIQSFLKEDENFYTIKLALIDEKCKKSIMFITLNRINSRFRHIFSYKKLYYILFWYLGIIRNLINIIQNNGNLIWLYYFFNNELKSSSYVLKYGLVNVFETMNYKRHPLDMERFNNYKIRLIYNYLKYKDISSAINIDRITIYIKNIHKNIAYLYSKFIINNDGTYSFNKNEFIYNHYESLNDRINTLQLIIEYFHNLDIEGRTINDKKKDIISVYYYIIILMPFALGTASISEIFLYSLWKFYIGSRLEIKQSIMLDVEALSHTFDDFYKNCFHHDENENNGDILRQIREYNEETYIPVVYTPYLTET